MAVAKGEEISLLGVVRRFKTDVYSKAPLKGGLLLIGGGMRRWRGRKTLEFDRSLKNMS